MYGSKFHPLNIQVAHAHALPSDCVVNLLHTACRSAAAQLNPAAAAPSPQVLSPANVAATTADGDTAFQAVVAFNRPVVGSQSLQSLAGMLRSSGLEDGRYGCVLLDVSGY